MGGHSSRSRQYWELPWAEGPGIAHCLVHTWHGQVTGSEDNIITSTVSGILLFTWSRWRYYIHSSVWYIWKLLWLGFPHMILMCSYSQHPDTEHRNWNTGAEQRSWDTGTAHMSAWTLTFCVSLNEPPGHRCSVSHYFCVYLYGCLWKRSTLELVDLVWQTTWSMGGHYPVIRVLNKPTSGGR